MLSMISRQLLQRSMTGFSGPRRRRESFGRATQAVSLEEPAYTQKIGSAKAPAPAPEQADTGWRKESALK
jgi:hypothetical protein